MVSLDSLAHQSNHGSRAEAVTLPPVTSILYHLMKAGFDLT